MLFAGLLLSVGCEKYTSDQPASSGVYLDGNCIVSIGSTFMASLVTITGFRYTGVTYSEPGQFIDFIGISRAVLDLDTPLSIPLEQGKYKGGCDLVSSVRITNYDNGTVKNQTTGDMNDDGKIDIEISLTDGRTLRIHYRGKILYDGYV